MTRRATLFVLFAVLVAACGAPRAETPDFTDDLASVVAEAQGSQVEPSEVAPPSPPDGNHVQTSPVIEPPQDFPSIAELRGLVAEAPHPYPRALITSRLSMTTGAEVLIAQMEITYFDGLVVWEDTTGFRQVFTPHAGTFYQAEDGTWQEATGTEWSVVGPLSDWSQAQKEAWLVLAADPLVVGYETVAETPTVRLLYVDGDDNAHVWLDETGATLRLVEEFTGPDGESRWVGVWSVETLSPEFPTSFPAR